MLKVELTPDTAQWVEAEIAAGNFATAKDAVRYAVTELRQNRLRATLDAAVPEGGSHTTADVRRYVRQQSEQRKSSDAVIRDVLTRTGDVMPWRSSGRTLPETMTKEQLIAGMEEISARSAARPVADHRSIDEIIGYDDFGLPR